MKKIALSLATIAAVCMLAVGATAAYFGELGVISGNTFSTGTVSIGGLESQSITAEGLAPGSWSSNHWVYIPYDGSLNADLYAGARGCSRQGVDSQYIADKLWVNIYRADGSYIWGGYSDWLSDNWLKVASNIAPGNHWFRLDFYLDPSASDSYQGQENKDTEFVIYATQVGVGMNNYTTSKPWETKNLTTCPWWPKS